MENEIFDDDLDILDVIQNEFPRNHWERPDYFEDMADLPFSRRFRLTKPSVLEILEQVEEQLGYNNRINNPVYPINQILLALRFYASNGHQISVGDFMGCAQNTASRIINKVSRAIAGLRPAYVHMPQLLVTQEKLYRFARFPRVVGTIDWTHIKIQSPGGDEAEIYRNRKHYFSMNTQLIGNADLKIMDIVARWPGSVHDSTIFNNSHILARFENNEFGQGLLLGDSGYGLRRFLLTPVLNPQTRAEHLYNEAHIRTRNTIERINGIWKRRFPVLAYVMRCRIDNVMPIIVATAILHNKARNTEELPPVPEDVDPDVLEHLIEQGNIPEMPAENEPVLLNHREQIIQNFFNNLVNP